MKNLGEFIDEKDIPRKKDNFSLIDTSTLKCTLGDMKVEKFSTIGYGVTYCGIEAGNGTGAHNTAVGNRALSLNQTGQYNTAIGSMAMYRSNRGIYNTAMGSNALENTVTGNQNTGIGFESMRNNLNGSSNTAVGFRTLLYNTSGSENVAIGGASLFFNTTGSYNVALGAGALYKNTVEGKNTALGHNALGTTDFSNTIGIGYNAAVTGANQAQIGDSSVTVYCYGAVQNRSDKRDKTDIQDTNLGLNFLLKLRPREFRWDYREDYVNTEEMAKELEAIEISNFVEEEKRKKINEIFTKHSLENVEKDGKKKGWRFHQGFIAQEVFETMRELGVDFGGYQDHSINGGKDVLSLGYEEFIPILVKGLQEQQEEIEALKLRIKKLEIK